MVSIASSLPADMTGQSLIAIAILLLIPVGIVFYLYFWPSIRLRRITGQPFPARWRLILRKRLPVYHRLPADLQMQLRNLIKRFIAEKRFVGCAGQVITDDVKISIAGQACMLLLNRETGCFAKLRSVLVYPSTFVARREETDAAGLVSETSHEMLGESWETGLVVLAWDEVRRGLSGSDAGQNVVLHEFAHQLDHEDGADNGAPLLSTRAAYDSWSKVFAEEYARLQNQGWLRQTSVLDPYGATSPAEFFAVATEAFFMRPLEMQSLHRKLYDELRNYYRVNPIDWLA